LKRFALSSLFLFLILSFNSSSRCDDLKPLAEKLNSKPSKLCLSEILELVGLGDSLSKALGDDFSILTDLIFSNLCFKQPKSVNISSDEITFIADANYKETNATAKIRLQKKNKIEIAIALQLNQPEAFKLGSLNSSLSKVDEIIRFNNLTIAFTTIDNDKPLFGTKNLPSGVSLSGEITAVGFVKDFATALGLSKINIEVVAPPGLKDFKDLIFNFEKIETGKRICPAGAMEALIKSGKLNIKPEVRDLLLNLISKYLRYEDGTEYCFGTNFGVIFDEDYNSTFYLAGDFEVKGKAFKFMLKLNDDFILTFGFASPSGPLKLGDIYGLFKPIDELLNFSDPLIALTNGKDQTIFDIDFTKKRKKVNPNLPGAIKISDGLSISAIVNTVGLLNTWVTGPSGIGKIKTSFIVPLQIIRDKSLKSLRIKFTPERDVCPLEIIKHVIKELNLEFANSIINIFNVCLPNDQTEIDLIFDDQSKPIFFISGNLSKVGLDFMLKVRSKLLQDKTTKSAFSVGVRVKDFKLSNINNLLSPFDSILTLYNPAVVFTNEDDEMLFDIDTQKFQVNPNLPFVVKDLKQGINIVAEKLQFKGILEKIFGQPKGVIRIPKGANKVEDIKIEISELKKVCLSGIPGIGAFISSLGDACIDVTKVTISLIKDSVGILISGELIVLGQHAPANLYIDMEKGAPHFLLETDLPNNLSFQTLTSKFGPLGQILKPLEELVNIELKKPENLNSPKLLISDTKSAREIKGVGAVNQGITIISNIEMRGILGELFKFLGLSNVDAKITIPLDPSKVEDFSISVEKPIDQNFPSGNSAVIKFKKFIFSLKGGTPPKISIEIDAMFDPSKLGMGGSPLGVKFSGAVKTGGIELVGDISGDVLNGPLGIPIQLKDPAFKIQLAGGAPTGFGLSGHLDLSGGRIIDLYSDLNLTDPLSSAFDFSIEKVCLTDLFALYTLATQKAFEIKLPDIFCMQGRNGKKGVEGSWALKQVNVTKDGKIVKTIPSGLNLRGTANIEFLNVSGDVDVKIDPSRLLLFAQGKLDKINIGNNLLIMSSADDLNKGPSLAIQIGLDKQEFKIDGLINLAGFFKVKQKILATRSGFNFELEAGAGDVVNPLLQAQISGLASFQSPVDFMLTVMFKQYLQDYIIDQVNTAFNEAKKAVESALNDAKNEINKVDDIAKDLRKKIQDAQGKLDSAKSALKSITDAKNSALTVLKAAQRGVSAIQAQIDELESWWNKLPAGP